MTDAKRIRVLLAKPGLDGHDQGAKVVVRAMMNAGFEVIYTGLRQTPEQVARIALEEDVDVIALSSLAGSHLPFCRKVKPLLDANGLSTPVIARMLRVGEKTGELGAMMERIAVFHDAETERAAEWLTRLFSPILMLAMGVIIGAVVVLMYLPIFQLAEQVK